MLTKKVTSLQHPFVLHCRKLRKNGRYRKEKASVFVGGKTLVQELSAFMPIEVLVTLEPAPSIPAKQRYVVPFEVLKKMSGLEHPDGFAAEVRLPEKKGLERVKNLLVLDELADPGNVGTLLRSAEAFGWDGVVVTPKTVDIWNEKVIRASRGAVFRLNIEQKTPEEVLLWVKRKKAELFVADLKGKKVQMGKYPTPKALVLSSEAFGPGVWHKGLAEKITIPMKPATESLNVSCAGAILLFAMRQA